MSARPPRQPAARPATDPGGAAGALREHCIELLGVAGPVRARRMFGGHGFYVDGLFVAILANDTLYLKTDAQTQDRFSAAGSHAFSYTAAGARRVVLGYWAAPEDAMESPAAMLPWARLAQAAALRAASTPASRRASKPAGTRKPRAG